MKKKPGQEPATPIAAAPGEPAPPARYEASATRVVSDRVHRAGVREAPMHGRVVGLRARAAGEMRPGKVPGSGVTATAHISADGVATAHGVPAAREVASSSEVAPAPSRVAATATASRVAATAAASRVAASAASSRVAASGVGLRIGQSRCTCYRNAEQEGSDGPYKCARSVHSDHSVAVAVVLEVPPATGLDASRARLFKPTHIKTRSRTGALTAIARMRAP